MANARLPERLLGVGVAHAALERIGLGGHLRSGGCRHLQTQQGAQILLVHGVRQVAEGTIGLVLVLHQRVALAEGAQADTGFQVVHILQMRHPPAIDDAKHDLRFQHAHDGLAKLGGLLRHHAVQICLKRLAHLRRIVIVIDLGHMEVVEARHRGRP